MQGCKVFFLAFISVFGLSRFTLLTSKITLAVRAITEILYSVTVFNTRVVGFKLTDMQMTRS